jgi:hypothetical protein
MVNRREFSKYTFLFLVLLLSAMLFEGVPVNGLSVDVGGVPSGLLINELMADNKITIAGPDGTYPDWIELYNAGEEIIDVSGMYLTDNLANPTRWQFPSGITIEPKGYLLIWANNSPDGSTLQAGFALGANGEEVGLFASDGVTLIDSVTFLKQIRDVSYGRVTDGSPNWDYLLNATPGWGNNKQQPREESSIWLVFSLIGIIGGLSGLVIITSKLHDRRRK